MPTEELVKLRTFAIEQAAYSLGAGADPSRVIRAATKYLDFLLNGAPSSPPAE